MSNIIKILIVLFLACITSFVIFSSNIYIAVVFLGIMLSTIVLVNVEIALWLILINVYIFSSFVKFYLPMVGSKIIWITDLVLLILLLKIFLDLIRQRVDLLKDKVNLLIFILLFLGIFSAAVNNEAQITLLCGIRNYFKYLPLFFVMRYISLKAHLIKRILTFFIGISIINVPISFFQLLAYHEPDSVGGVFSGGGSGVLCLFQILMVGCLLFFLKYKIVKKRISFFLSVFILTPIFINETKLVFIILPITLIFIYRDYFFKKITHTIIITFFTIAILFSISLVYSRVLKDFSFEKTFSSDYLYEYLYKMPYFSNEGSLNEKSLNRLSALQFAYNNVSRNTFNLFFGVGPGNASFSQLTGGIGDYYRKFFYLKIDFIFLSRLLWEYGIIGMSLFFWLIYLIWKQSTSLLRKVNDNYIKCICSTSNLLILLLVITCIYNLSFQLEVFGCMFWLLAGFLFKYDVLKYNKEGVNT